MFFGPKIVCEQCNKKTKEATSLYRRGSRFCSAECIAAWEAANPPPVARGDETKLRDELAMLVREAVTENHRRTNPAFGHTVSETISAPNGAQITRTVTSGISLGSMDEAARQEQMQASRALFQSYVLRAAPILRALGFTNEATLIDSNDFTTSAGAHLVGPLEAVMAKLR